MKTLIILLLFGIVAFAQQPLRQTPFSSTNDKMTGVTADTVDMRIAPIGMAFAAWNLDVLTITAGDVTGEVVKVIDIDSKAWFSYADLIDIRVRNGQDTLTSGAVSISGYSTLTLFFQPDTLETGATDTTQVVARLIGVK